MSLHSRYCDQAFQEKDRRLRFPRASGSGRPTAHGKQSVGTWPAVPYAQVKLATPVHPSYPYSQQNHRFGKMTLALRPIQEDYGEYSGHSGQTKCG